MMLNDYHSWFEKAYPALSGYGLWLRGCELNTLPAREWETKTCRVLITRLSTYRDTIDSFTHKLLYQIAAGIRGVFPDLAWLPPPKDAEIFNRDAVPWLLGATSKRGGRDFDMIAFSNAIVQELVNLPVMLEKSGIPRGKRARMADPSLPIVILGGASAACASVLFSEDPLVDGIFVGEDATTIARIFRLCKESREQGLPKTSVFAALEEIPGFISPEGNRVTKVFHAPVLPDEQLLEAGPVFMSEDSLGKGNLQISEGCACFCGFCAESFSRKPYREYNTAQLRSKALLQKALMGVDDMQLYSFNFNMHRDFYGILKELAPLFPSIGLKSQRFDAFSEDPQLVNYLHAVDKTSITCGLEGISGRLRRYLHKSIDEQDLKKSLFSLLSAPLRELKIFLIATGIEETTDFDEFRELLGYIKTVMNAAVRKPRILFSMTILVRFPHTPLEFENAPTENVCRDILRRTERAVKNAGFEFRASAEAADYWFSQVLVRAADPRIARALWRAREACGFVYYREIPPAFVHRFRQELESQGLIPDTLLKGHSPEERAAKPWACIATGVDEKFLAGQWKLAREFRDAGYCAGVVSGEGVCIGCNACTDGNEKTRLLGRQTRSREYRVEDLKNVRQTAKAEQQSLCFRVTAGPLARGVPRAALGIALARACMLTESGLTEGYRGFGGSFIGAMFGSNWIMGDDSITLLWNRGNRPRIETLFADASFVEQVNRLMGGFGSVAGLVPSSGATVRQLRFESPWLFDPARYCRDKSISCMRRKMADNGYQYELSKDSLKKRIFSDLRTAPPASGCCSAVIVEHPGPKFNPEEFARTAFPANGENEWVRITISAKLS